MKRLSTRKPMQREPRTGREGCERVSTSKAYKKELARRDKRDTQREFFDIDEGYGDSYALSEGSRVERRELRNTQRKRGESGAEAGPTRRPARGFI
jgi:hypothetical protein